MLRLLPALVVVFLLGGTAAAFAVTQGLKLEKTPVLSPRIDKELSPVCECDTDAADIAFVLREGDTATVQVVDGDGEVVQNPVRGPPFSFRQAHDPLGRQG